MFLLFKHFIKNMNYRGLPTEERLGYYCDSNEHAGSIMLDFDRFVVYPVDCIIYHLILVACALEYSNALQKYPVCL